MQPPSVSFGVHCWIIFLPRPTGTQQQRIAVSSSAASRFIARASAVISGPVGNVPSSSTTWAQRRTETPNCTAQNSGLQLLADRTSAGEGKRVYDSVEP